MKLTKCLIRRKVKKLAGQGRGWNRRFCTLDDARKILVLFDAEDSGAIEPCLEKLRAQHKDVRVCMYTSECVAAEMDGMTVCAETDTDMWYMPRKAIERRFCACDADIIIDLTHSGNYIMQYLLLKHPALFKVGTKSGEPDLYDLTIYVTENRGKRYVFEQIVFYLQTIRFK